MKLSYRQIEPFVKNPDRAARVILIYGPDAGLVKERGDTIGKTVTPDLSDPFNVITLTNDVIMDDPARLSAEANAISMMGGDRLIFIKQASDKITPIVKDYLESPSAESLVVIIAGELSPRSKLRVLCEKAKNAAALPCYVEDARGLTNLIRETLAKDNIRIQPDAVTFLSQHITGDRAKVRSELEKLVLYKGQNDNTPITLNDATACCGTDGAMSIDDLVYAIGDGRSKDAMEAYKKLLTEGVNFIVILRSLQNHYRRIHLARGHLDAGLTVEEALRKIRPAIFFKVKDSFIKQVRKSDILRIENILQKLYALEADCKKTGAPVETLCGQAVLSLSRL